MGDAIFEASYAKLGTSGCKRCKTKIEKGALRIAKLVANPYSSVGGDMRQYHHPKCLFDSFVKARLTTKIITEPDDIRGFDDILEEDQDFLSKLIEELCEKKSGSGKKSRKSKSKGDGTSKKKGSDDDDDFIDDSELDDLMSKTQEPTTSRAAAATTPSRPAATATPSRPSAPVTPSRPAGAPVTPARPPAAPVTPARPSTSATPSRPTPSSTLHGPPNGGGKSLDPVAAAMAAADAMEKDCSFREFRKLCAGIAEESSYLGKTKVLSTFLEKGATGTGFRGDVFLLLKLLLPGVIKYVYNLQDKQLIRHFSTIFSTDVDEMAEDLEQGDVAETVALFFDKSQGLKAQKKSTLSLQEVDNMLADLAEKTRDDDQIESLKKIARRCTTNDLKMIIRLIKHDLRINAGAKHILDALDPNAYEAFQTKRDLRDVVNRVIKKNCANTNLPVGELAKSLSVTLQLMTPIQPMLAEACRSVAQAFSRCQNGMYAEIKYDGERVQIHKQGSAIKYFSRSLKPVQAHKIQHIQEFIKQAFPRGRDLILDGEVLLIDTTTSKPLPFGTLGVHKKTQFKDANVCLFVFDCIYFNGENLLDKPMKDRRQVMMDNMIEIPNRIMFSELNFIQHGDINTMTDLLTKVFSEGLEGLVLKDINGTYEPGKRHWLKVKKDYLAEGTMADSADLVVLGSYFGSGGKGGMMSIFLMGCYDPETFRWCTVTKCGVGIDDKIVKRLQKQLDVEKISKDPKKVPPWLNVTKTLVPDFVVKDPKKSQVWEITGAEFSSSNIHTAKGISIRFPRMSKIRDDKTPQQATDLPQLLRLFAGSRRKSDVPELLEKKQRSRELAEEEEPMDEEEKQHTDDEIVDEINDDDAQTFSKIMAKKRAAAAERTKEKETEASPAPAAKKNDAPSGPPAKKVKKDKDPATLPPCRYGAECYQIGAEHRKKFSHPAPVAKPTVVPADPDNSPLHDIFTGCKFLVPGSLADRDIWVRYIIAYNGDVVADHDGCSATHVIVDPSVKVAAKVPDNANQVTTDWVTRCIKQKRLME